MGASFDSRRIPIKPGIIIEETLPGSVPVAHSGAPVRSEISRNENIPKTSLQEEKYVFRGEGFQKVSARGYVAELQARLSNWIHEEQSRPDGLRMKDLVVDGKFGPKTAHAVRMFKEQQGLPTNGSEAETVTPEMIAKLMRHGPNLDKLVAFYDKEKAQSVAVAAGAPKVETATARASTPRSASAAIGGDAPMGAVEPKQEAGQTGMSMVTSGHIGDTHLARLHTEELMSAHRTVEEQSKKPVAVAAVDPKVEVSGMSFESPEEQAAENFRFSRGMEVPWKDEAKTTAPASKKSGSDGEWT